MFSFIPLEVLLAIVNKLTDPKDLKRMCEVSKYLNRTVTPILYKTISLEAKHEAALHLIDVETLLQIPTSPVNLLHLADDFRVTSQFHYKLSERCFHHRFANRRNILSPSNGSGSDKSLETQDKCNCDDSYEASDGHSERSTSLEGSAASLVRLLSRCKDGGLRSFTWELGTCIPPEILGPEGYLPLRQRGIESIRLVTDGACPLNREIRSPIALSAFENLKKLSWSGPIVTEEFDALRKCLQLVSDQLVEFDLDLIDWNRVPFDPGNPFAPDILGMCRHDTKLEFPALKVLSLSGVYLEQVETISWLSEISTRVIAEELVDSLDSTILRSLKLRFCPGWEGFLSYLANFVEEDICLKSLEIQSNSDRGQYETNSIIDYLEAFEGLEELFLATNAPAQTLDIWDAALHHKSTLRNFVHHQTRVGDSDTESACDTKYDERHLSLTKRDVHSLRGPSENPFRELYLECFGICCDPKFLKSILSPPTVAKRGLRVLHIRESGSDYTYPLSRFVLPEYESDYYDDVVLEGGEDRIPRDLHKFAQWSFGPDGFPSLQVLAVGDFSYKGRYSDRNLLLCRKSRSTSMGQTGASDQTYRFVRDTDQGLWEVVKKFSNVLEACPTDAILGDEMSG